MTMKEVKCCIQFSVASIFFVNPVKVLNFGTILNKDT